MILSFQDFGVETAAGALAPNEWCRRDQFGCVRNFSSGTQSGTRQLSSFAPLSLRSDGVNQ